MGDLRQIKGDQSSLSLLCESRNYAGKSRYYWPIFLRFFCGSAQNPRKSAAHFEKVESYFPCACIFSIFAQASRSGTVRLNTSLPWPESLLSTQK